MNRTPIIRVLITYAVITAALLTVVALTVDRAGVRRGAAVWAVGLTALGGGVGMWLAARAAGNRFRRVTGTLEVTAAGLQRRVDEAHDDRARLEQILEAMTEGVLLIQADGSVGFANRAARRILGGAPTALRTLAPHGLRELVEQARGSPTPARREVDVGPPPRRVEATGLAMGPREVLLILRDVTAARRVEAMRRDFVADASHELKTPAASIRAGAETLRRALHEDPEAAARFAAQLNRDAERLSRIVTDLLDLSRLETEQPSFEDVRLDAVVADHADAAQELAAEAGVALEVNTVPTTVRGSSRDLGLLVGNLLDNALRYTPAGGRVRVEVAARDGEAVLTIADTGIGIPSRDLPRIFERFYRVDRARSRDTGGTGLGLSIVRHVAEQHGGRVEADSELARGSTFRVILPAAA